MDVDDRGRIRFSAKEVLRVQEQRTSEFNPQARATSQRSRRSRARRWSSQACKPNPTAARATSQPGDVFATS